MGSGKRPHSDGPLFFAGHSGSGTKRAASGYFHFSTGEASSWIDATVPVDKISALTLERWIGEYKRPKKLNTDMMRTKGHATAARQKTSTSGWRGARGC
jgi:hypothetical protein